ncbi:MAG: glycine dehydrogenase, partial [Deltaproteobacteria bacterium]|nr:glycine dehydrogenase [Deltaproteobacteria bacterium]
LQKGILGGFNLKRFYPELSRHILLCVTEMNSRDDMDTLIEEVASS